MKNDEIQKHIIAARKLNAIKDRVFRLIGKNIGRISEHEVNVFIFSEFKKEGLVTEKKCSSQIAACGPDTSFVHYFPKKRGSRVIRKNELVLIDIWAKLDRKDAPFADITWMGYTGKSVPKDIQETFGLVLGARDAAIKFLKSNLRKKKLPGSKGMENSARGYFKKYGVEKHFPHGLGHSLSAAQVHGTYFRFSRKSDSRMKTTIPFTIEPGLYFKDKFGVRSEIDCYVTADYKFVVTGRVQKEIVRV